MSEKLCTRCKKPVKTGLHRQELAGGMIREIPTWECQNCQIKYFEGWLSKKVEANTPPEN